MSQKKDFWVLAGEYTPYAFLMPALTLIGYAIGYLLDGLFGTTFLKVVFLLLGIAAGFVELLRQAQKDARNRSDG